MCAMKESWDGLSTVMGPERPETTSEKSSRWKGLGPVCG